MVSNIYVKSIAVIVKINLDLAQKLQVEIYSNVLEGKLEHFNCEEIDIKLLILEMVWTGLRE